MKLHHFDNASQYYERVKSFLLQYEADHNLILGIINNLIHHPERFSDRPYLATVEADDTLLAVALKSPSQKLLLSRSLHIQAVEVIAQDLHLRQEQLPAVLGPKPEAKAFVEVWRNLTGTSYQKAEAQRIYQLETVQQIPKASGYFRLANEGDLYLLIDWCKAFTKEALGDAVFQNVESIVERRLSEGMLCMWQDNVPVSMAGFGGFTPNGVRIGLVYTPPEYRKKGYASSCVAALSQTLRDRGYKYCFLFADLANPTSNHIYQTIGYQPVCDVLDYWLED